MTTTLFVLNDNLLEIVNLKDGTDDSTITGTVVSDAGGSVTVTLVDADGVEVSGETWPLALSHVANGLWRATLSDTLSLTRNAFYVAQITVNAGAGKQGYWEVVCPAETRS